MQSSFSARTLAEIFRDLYLSERSGVLILDHQGADKRFHFYRGMIHFAESADKQEDLGPLLLGEGKLSAGALSEARASLADPTDRVQLAQALLKRELIGKASLQQTVRSVVLRAVRSVFLWPEGGARFEDGLPGEAVFETDIIATIEIMLQGIAGMTGFVPIHEAMCGLDNRLRVRQPTPIPLERLTLSPSHGFILSRVDGNTSMNELISLLPPGEEEVASRFVFGLLLLGVLEYEPSLSDGPFKVTDILRDHADRQALERMQEMTILQVYEHIREQNPYEILGLALDANRHEIERAYDRMKSQLSRERLLPRVREKYRSELAVVESRLIEAFLSLTQPGDPPRGDNGEHGPPEGIEVDDLLVRVEMDKAKSQLALEEANRIADAYYAKARRCVREGDFHNAIQYGKLAISYNQSDARYYYMLADCQARNPEARWQRLAMENYTRATQLDPWNAEYWIGLGRFFKKRGLRLRAKKQFEEALKLVPNNADVLSEMESLG